MLRRLRFDCGACAASFVDWHEQSWEQSSVYCVHCGEPIGHGIPVESRQTAAVPYGARKREAESALGLLKSTGHEFPETLRGLRTPRAPLSLLESISATSDRDALSSDADGDTEPGLRKLQSWAEARALQNELPFARATSSAPRPRQESSSDAEHRSFWSRQHPRLAALGGLLLGFGIGVPLTCLAEGALARVRHPIAHESLELGNRLAATNAALDDGNLERARALLDSCKALTSEGDHRVSSLRARLAFEGADAEWLRRRALQGLAHRGPDETRKAFADQAFLAMDSARREHEASPHDTGAWALAVDGLRIYGDTERAVALARGLPEADAEANYALGTLGIATPDEKPGAFLPYLKAAAEGSSARARTRAALTLGLILANQPDAARRELSAVQAFARLHPATEDLQRLFDAEFAPAKIAAASAPSLVPATPAPVKPAIRRPTPTALLVATARDWQRQSRLADAQRLYEAVLRTRPDDSEARAGLAEVELLRGSLSEAEALYERTLQTNDNYVPAYVALADIDWQQGRLERAACRYQMVVDRFPEGTYPPYIVGRVAHVMGSGATPPAPRPNGDARDACGN